MAGFFYLKKHDMEIVCPHFAMNQSLLNWVAADNWSRA